MNLLLLLVLSTVPDYCAWQEPREPFPLLKPDGRVMTTNSLEIHRGYSAVWARCALDRGGKAPVLRVTANDGDGQGRRVLVEKAVKVSPSLDPDSKPFIHETFQACDAPTNKRGKGAVLSGPVGQRRWNNPRKLTVELLATGPMAPLAFKTEIEVLCQACISERKTASMSHYVHEHSKNETRFYVSVPKERHACAEGGGRMILRRYWTDKGGEAWSVLNPYEVTDNLQTKLRPKDDTMFYESLEPGARFCKEGKTNLWEVIGLDEYSTIVNHSGYGPSAHIRRDGIEFLKCK